MCSPELWPRMKLLVPPYRRRLRLAAILFSDPSAIGDAAPKRLQALDSRNFRSFLEDSVAHVLPVFVAGRKAVAVEQLAALCDRFEVRRTRRPPR